MDTFIAHAHVLEVFAAAADDAVAPDQWCHDLTDGSLTYRFSGSPNTYTWDADGVASLVAMASADRSSALLTRWAAVRRFLDRSGHRDPDQVYIDHGTDEVTLVWHAERVALIIDADGDGATGDRGAAVDVRGDLLGSSATASCRAGRRRSRRR